MLWFFSNLTDFNFILFSGTSSHQIPNREKTDYCLLIFNWCVLFCDFTFVLLYFLITLLLLFCDFTFVLLYFLITLLLLYFTFTLFYFYFILLLLYFTFTLLKKIYIYIYIYYKIQTIRNPIKNSNSYH